MLERTVAAEIKMRDEQIADANRMIKERMAEILEKLQADPEADIKTIIDVMLTHDRTRRTAKKVKENILWNARTPERQVKAAGID